MTTNRRRAAVQGSTLLLVWASLVSPAAQAPAAQADPSSAVTSTCEEMERFLSTAKVIRRRDLSVGVTLPSRATLDDGTRRHDAAIQNTDVRKMTFPTPRGTEVNFRDAWQFNVAGYELAKLLRLNMVPPYVERTIGGRSASVSWWVDDAMMERERYQKKIRPPDVDRWNREMYAVRVFRALIGDTDPNMTNVLITKDWRIWMIDFTRAFRRTTTLDSPNDLKQIDRKLLAGLQTLTADDLRRTLGRWLEKPELDAVLARRDLIVRHFDAAVAARGEAALLYDFDRTSEPCGAGLR